MRSAALSVVFSLVLMPQVVFAQSDSEVSDPLESVNRGIFWFNDEFDVNLLEPVAQGYHDVVPDTVETGVKNFFKNLRYPMYLVSDIVQLKFTQALEHTGRFVVNTTVGVAGLIDVGKHIGLPDHEEDFGIALAYHGVPAGPYIVLPFLGPSNMRDTVGLVVDTVLNPFYWLGHTNLHSDAQLAIASGATVLKAIDTRVRLLDGVKTAKDSSVDYYLFVQGVYYQYRRGELYDGNPPEEEDEITVEKSPSNNAAR